MLAFARKTNPAVNVTYSLADAQTIGDNPDWQDKFDKAVSFFVLHWCPDHAKTLKSILACLKPEGEALFIVVNRASLVSDMNTFIMSHVKWGGYAKVR